jgi:signal peptidase
MLDPMGGFVKILSYLGMCLMVLLLAIALFTLLAPRFDWRVDAVISGSMEPKLGMGSVAVTRPVKALEIQPGDIITFHSPLNGKLTSHRVVALVQSTPLSFKTKGDANEDIDPFIVPIANVVGKVSFHVPYLGYVTKFVKTRWGILLTLFVPGLIIIAMEIRNIWRELSAKETEKKRRIIKVDR